MRKPKSEYSIRTVTNALRVLAAFRDEVEIGVAELSRRLALHKNNVFRLLATLEEGGYIEQDPKTERYRLGIAILDLGQSYLRGRPLLERARPCVDELADDTGESAHLGLLDDFEVVHVCGRGASRLIVAPLRVGMRLPVHCTALGKVLLGCSPEGPRRAHERMMRDGGGLVARTGRSIVDPDKFVEHLRTVAGQGFATDIDECEPGLSCVAAPIHDVAGRVVAGLSVSAPSVRMPEQQLMREVLPRVVSVAERLSRELGFHAP